MKIAKSYRFERKEPFASARTSFFGTETQPCSTSLARLRTWSLSVPVLIIWSSPLTGKSWLGGSFRLDSCQVQFPPPQVPVASRLEVARSVLPVGAGRGHAG